MDRFIDITQLSKSFGQQKVLDNIDFRLEKSEIIGLIGPSGSGKSTLIKTMLGMEKADTGKALVLDKIMPERKILGNIGYMAQSDALYEALTGYENLEFFGQMKNLKGEKLKEEAQKYTFNIGKVKIVANTTAELLESDSEVKDEIYRQSFGPVKWVDTINKLKSLGVIKIYEIGAGKVLSGLIKKIDKEIEVENIELIKA